MRAKRSSVREREVEVRVASLLQLVSWVLIIPCTQL